MKRLSQIRFLAVVFTVLLSVGIFSLPHTGYAIAYCKDLGVPEASITIDGYGTFTNSQQEPSADYTITVPKDSILRADIATFAEDSSFDKESWPMGNSRTYGGPWGGGREYVSDPITEESFFAVSLIQNCQRKAETVDGPVEVPAPEGDVTVQIKIASSTTVITPQPVCSAQVSPIRIDSATGKATAVFSASEGDGSNYVWAAGDNDALPRSYTGNPYSVAYTTAGTKTVQVTSGGLINTCDVEVLPPSDGGGGDPGGKPPIACTDPTSIIVDSNTPATWQIDWGGTGSTPYRYSQTVPSTHMDYFSVPFGPYGITASADGYTLRSVEADPTNKTISACGDSLHFILDFQQNVVQPPQSSATVRVTSNMLTNWTLTGPQSESGSSIANATYTDMPAGTYVIVAQSKPGFDMDVSPTDAQSVADGGTITFAITYTPKTCQNEPTLEVQPPSQTVMVGSSTYYQAFYDADGDCAEWSQEVTMAADWSSGNDTIAAVQSPGRYRGVEVGSTDVIAEYAGLTAFAVINVTDVPVDNFHYSCVQNACTKVNGAGNNTDGCSASNVGSSCGVNNNFHYSCVQNACTKVNGAGNNTDGCSQSNVGSSCGQPAYHAECVANSCVQMAGAGPNRCTTDASCGGDGKDFHGVCDAAQRACVNVAGAGVSTCATDPACNGIGLTHLTCEGNACVIIGGAGTNEDGCTAIGDSCTTTDTTGSCTFKANPNIVKKGDPSTLSWSCGGGITQCSILDTGISGGKIGSGRVTPQVTTQYTLSCNRGTTRIPVSVYVVQSYKEVPPGN